MTRPVKSKVPEAPTKDAASGQANRDVADADSKDVVDAKDHTSSTLAKEFGGQKGPEPTRYGDWEKNGRCTDF